MRDADYLIWFLVFGFWFYHPRNLRNPWIKSLARIVRTDSSTDYADYTDDKNHNQKPETKNQIR